MSEWEFDWSPNFEKLYRKKDDSLKPKIREKLKTLSQGEPYKLGTIKKGLVIKDDFCKTRIYTIEIDKSNRIAYCIYSRNSDHIIRLLKVCDHKAVYGHD